MGMTLFCDVPELLGGFTFLVLLPFFFFNIVIIIGVLVYVLFGGFLYFLGVWFAVFLFVFKSRCTLPLYSTWVFPSIGAKSLH